MAVPFLNKQCKDSIVGILGYSRDSFDAKADDTKAKSMTLSLSPCHPGCSTIIGQSRPMFITTSSSSTPFLFLLLVPHTLHLAVKYPQNSTFLFA